MKVGTPLPRPAVNRGLCVSVMAAVERYVEFVLSSGC